MWGSETGEPLVLLHGIRDTSVTFQFLVDSLQRDWWVIAPDWRGHGYTEPLGAYAWFHDYLADLEGLLAVLTGPRPVNLVGHSLGGNVATVYAALRPERVRRVLAVDAFGLTEAQPRDYIQLLQGWLMHGVMSADSRPAYPSVEGMAQRLCAANCRLSWGKALYIAEHSSRRLANGELTWRFHSRPIRSMPTLRRLDEWVECWARIQAPALWVASSEPLPGSARADAAAFEYLRERIGEERIVLVEETGHNLQHDAPGVLAGVIEGFM
jgi:pimeloyl-ACP methyl ester carboxylesterase